MTALVQNIRRHGLLIPPKVRGISRRALVVAAMVAVISMVPNGWPLALDALSEAFLAVTVFVAGTLALVFAAVGYGTEGGLGGHPVQCHPRAHRGLWLVLDR